MGNGRWDTSPENRASSQHQQLGGQTQTIVEAAGAAADDLFRLERRVRDIAEEEVRKLHGVLQQVAYMWVGEQYEAELRKAPDLLQRWRADDWAAFFRRVAPASAGWHDPDVLEDRLREVTEERDALQAELREERDRREVVESVVAQGGAAVVPTDAGNQGTDQPYVRPGFEWPEVPKRAPAAYAQLFSKWKREGLALALMARGLSTRLEVATLVGKFFGTEGRSGSIKRIFSDRLEPRGLIESEVVTVAGAKTMIVWLTEKGRKVCEAAQIPVQEGEYERMLRLHGGEGQKEHAAATAVFAYHARRRGWQAEVVPEVEGKAEPDAAVWHDDEDRVYVEVELGRGKERKWRNLAKLQGHVALCAANPDARGTLVREVKQLRLAGYATDILSLIKQQREGEGELWLEQWDK